MIVSNAFMKRAFGKKLIEGFLRHKDLTHVIDASGVYLPGHGTPTTLLIARNAAPVGATVRAVLGIRGQVGIPPNPPEQPVWLAIVDQVDRPGSESQWISVTDAPRQWFENHPWSIGGGGAAELTEAITEEADLRLIQLVDDIGVQVITGEEDVFVRSHAALVRQGIHEMRPFLTGDDIRDWSKEPSKFVIDPYKDGAASLSELSRKALWPWRSRLEQRKYFGQSQVVRGYSWWEYSIVMRQRTTPPALALADVASHVRVVYETDKVVFDQHSPVLKLSPGSGADEYLAVLGLLNSSTACFWLRQNCFPKGGNTVGQEGARVRPELWDVYFEFDNTKLKQFPVPRSRPLELTKLLQDEADARSAVMPAKLCTNSVPTREALDEGGQKASIRLARMVALQEELDWTCYRLYGILDEDLNAPLDQIPLVELGQRAFEIRMAREMDQGQLETVWFSRHHSIPVTDFPAHWPDAYRRVCVRRLEVTASNRDIGLIEQPEFKRRWNLPTWEEMEQAALRDWLLDRIEANAIWRQSTLLSCSQLRDALARDADWLSVAAIYKNAPVQNLDALVIDLATSEAVPFLPVLRYTEEGLRKRKEWEQVWNLQRAQDAGETVEIQVPPKYRNTDFKSGCWGLRGGLDVPKERFILYPGLERDSDRSPVLGWAGWNHLEQAKSLAGYCQRMRTEEGWEPERLKPVLAGLLDLKPWLLQWHNELDPETGVKLGEYFVQFAESQCQELGFSPEEVRAWQPAATTSSRAQTRRTNARRSQ